MAFTLSILISFYTMVGILFILAGWWYYEKEHASGYKTKFTVFYCKDCRHIYKSKDQHDFDNCPVCMKKNLSLRF